jgi:nucleoid DNA-binding protein
MRVRGRFTGLVKEKEVAKLLSDETTLNPKEAEMTLYQLLKVIIRLLLDGHTVQLGELGLTCKTLCLE